MLLSSTSAISVTFNTTYDEGLTPISQLACYREDASIIPDFGYPEGDILSSISPRIMGLDTIRGPGSSACGSCWVLVYGDEARPFLAVDRAKSGITVSLEGMNSLTGGKAQTLSHIDVKATQVSLLSCGLYIPPNNEL
ncbi:related to Protein SnodProt1 [Fusarium torulosum]|uniref:Related to Protein SnodProt1 n=1 Tax=Fusarium torulosum TaxID=33205 RepID=A0AAE8MN54_9HYPO|nr:related to Protein SnodProt1 [Fusarium torulosum]